MGQGPVAGDAYPVMWNRILTRLIHLGGTLALGACLAVCPHHPGTGVHANIPLRTLGGLQFWGDVEWHDGWRIQEHVLLRHHRLLDPEDVRRAWGSRSACRAVLDGKTRATPVARHPQHLVLLLHGLGRSRHSMEPLAERLDAAGFSTACLAYPSTRAGLEEHARRLNGLLDELHGVSQVSFVTHSMGGLVLRKALGQEAAWRARIGLGRVVQLGPPNQGSQLARRVRHSPIGWLLGPALTSVATDEASDLPLLPCDVAVVAGGKSDRRGWNPFLDGDDDGVVRVEETRLEGAGEHHHVRALHTVLMEKEEVGDIVLRFLTR